MAENRTLIIGAVLIVILLIGGALIFLRDSAQQATQTPAQTTPTPTPKGPFELKIFTGGTAGVYYPLGTKLAELLNAHASDKISASAATSGASVANVRALAQGEAHLIFVQNDIAYYGYNGIFMFENEKVTQLRGVAVLYPEIIQIVVRADSGIRSLEDLAGKIVAVGAKGSGTAVEAELILKAAGVWDKIKPEYSDFRAAAEGIKLGQIHAAFIVAGVPTAAIQELTATTPIKLLPIPDSVLNELKARGYTFFTRAVVPKDAYKLDADVPTLAVKAMIAVRNDVPEEVVYSVLSVMFDRLSELRAAHARAADISLSTALDGMPIPLHPGAVKFYREKGITVPRELVP